MNALTTGEACEKLQLTHEALWELVGSGDLVAFRVGRYNRGLRISGPSMAKYLGLEIAKDPAAVVSQKPRERRRWRMMRSRCEDSRLSGYKYYGARGIKVCERWHDFEAYFADIMRLIGACPDGHSIDRIDNDGDYEPGNVRWATPTEQMANRRVSKKVPA